MLVPFTSMPDSAVFAALVLTAFEGSDQSLSPSPFFARTRNWYSVFAVSPVMVVVTAVPVCVKSIHAPPVPSRYCTS